MIPNPYFKSPGGGGKTWGIIENPSRIAMGRLTCIRMRVILYYKQVRRTELVLAQLFRQEAADEQNDKVGQDQ